MMQDMPEVLFSDFFKVTKHQVMQYGAFDVSLLTDLPLFIDPFLLFHSKKAEYQKLHNSIIDYLRFLKEKAASGQIDKGLLDELFTFREIRENWLGFSVSGNHGRGLGLDFACTLNDNLRTIFTNFGGEKISQASHLEKLCLIKDGVGRDTISDFTTNLIKEYLLEYTQKFANKYIDKKYCKHYAINKVRFNYSTEAWETDTYYLPSCRGDYVLLTPRDMLTKDESWINKNDFYSQFEQIPHAIPNDNLRSKINNYFYSVLPKEPSKEQRFNAIKLTVNKYPELIDYYIKQKEMKGEQAQSSSERKVKDSECLYLYQFSHLIELLTKTAFYSNTGKTHKEAILRINYLRDVIENKGGHKIFYINGKPIRTEADLKILYRMTWFGTELDAGTEANDGRGPADYKISLGAKDKTIVEFKLASNPQLKRNLKKQVEIYKKASDAQKGVHVIIYFTKEEFDRVLAIISELKLKLDEDVFLIDARNDNKPSGSKA